jgi:hypothetical protein
MKNSQNFPHIFELQAYVKQVGTHFIEEFAFHEDHIAKPLHKVK